MCGMTDDDTYSRKAIREGEKGSLMLLKGTLVLTSECQSLDKALGKVMMIYGGKLLLPEGNCHSDRTSILCWGLIHGDGLSLLWGFQNGVVLDNG